MTLLAAALGLLLAGRGAMWRRTGRKGHPSRQDVFVLGALLCWWLIGPVFHDDGWIRARETNALASGGFSTYYEYWGVNLPLSTWFEWLEQLVVAHTGSLAVHRIPVVAVLIATWIFCRSCLIQLVGGPTRRDAVWWTAALTFVLGAMAFGMTLRPEPEVALLAVVVLASCVRYSRSPRLVWLALGVLTTGLAVTIHPAGLVAVTPLIVCLPRVVRDARGRTAVSWPGVATLLPIGLAWTLLLGYLDSDASHRGDDAAIVRGAGGHGDGPLQELQRYGRLWEGGGSAVRRAFVVLLLLAIAAFLIGRLPKRNLTERLPAASLMLALLALAFTPSKWIWHFGALIGFSAVAVGFELHRLRTTRLRGPSDWLIATVILAGLLVSTLGPTSWGPLDTARLNWAAVPFVELMLAAVAVGLVAGYVRRRVSPQQPQFIVLPAALAALIATTVIAFVADAVAADGWTPLRQTLASAAGRRSCGIGDDIEIPRLSSMQPLARLGSDGIVREVAVHHGSLFPIKSISGTRRQQWFLLREDPTGLFVRGSWVLPDQLEVTWGMRVGSHIRAIKSGAVDLRQASRSSNNARWRFVGEESFPGRPNRATAVRFRLVGRNHQPTTGLSIPVSFERARLREYAVRSNARVLVSPYLYEAIPCANLPVLRYGVAEKPDLLVDWVALPTLTWTTGPFVGLLNISDLLRVPVLTRDPSRENIQVYFVHTDPRDVMAPIERTTIH